MKGGGRGNEGRGCLWVSDGTGIREGEKGKAYGESVSRGFLGTERSRGSGRERGQGEAIIERWMMNG